MAGREVVVRSIESPDGTYCVDIFRRADASFGFAEYRRDPEDPRGWRPTGRRSDEGLATGDAALAEARRLIPWVGAAGA